MGQLGSLHYDDSDPRPIPNTTPQPAVLAGSGAALAGAASDSAGNGFACARAGGGAALWCWGNDSIGQLGNGGTASSATGAGEVTNPGSIASYFSDGKRHIYSTGRRRSSAARLRRARSAARGRRQRRRSAPPRRAEPFSPRCQERRSRSLRTAKEGGAVLSAPPAMQTSAFVYLFIFHFLARAQRARARAAAPPSPAAGQQAPRRGRGLELRRALGEAPARGRVGRDAPRRLGRLRPRRGLQLVEGRERGGKVARRRVHEHEAVEGAAVGAARGAGRRAERVHDLRAESGRAMRWWYTDTGETEARERAARPRPRTPPPPAARPPAHPPPQRLTLAARSCASAAPSGRAASKWRHAEIAAVPSCTFSRTPAASAAASAHAAAAGPTRALVAALRIATKV
jgi:hypothetical protein